MTAKLTPKQAEFVAEYLRNGKNAAGAYRVVYAPNTSPQRAAEEGHALLGHPKISPIIAQAEARAASAVEAVVEQHVLDQEGLAQRLIMLGTFDARSIFTWTEKGVRLKPSAEISDAAAFSIVGISEGQHGLTVRLADKHAALMSLAKLRGWLIDRGQQLGADGQPVDPMPKFVLLEKT